MRKISGRFGAVAMMTALTGMMLAGAIAAPAQTFTSLLSFNGTDGFGPDGLVQGTDGNLWATCGEIVCKISLGGNLTTLGETGTVVAQSGLIQAADRSCYGTSPTVPGTILKITPRGELTTIYTFCSQGGSCPNGSYPYGGLVQALDGNFYGTTAYGGAYGEGTVFKITPSGSLTTLYNFCPDKGCIDGASPDAGLVQATDGDFYGVTDSGGMYDEGTVFKITPGGTLTTLHRFDYYFSGDGEYPQAPLIQAADGDLYGTTSGTSSSGYGTVFKITTTGTLTTLVKFDFSDGATPAGPLVEGTDGNFYGVTVEGGTTSCNIAYEGCGTIFQMAPTGNVQTLHIFTGSDGNGPAWLIQETNGAFYGTTGQGGSYCGSGGCGTIFSLSMGLGPFIKTEPTVGKAGAVIGILGNNLTAATSVTFNGTPASFTVSQSGTYMSATVPAGATSGPVQVVTRIGTLTSNVNFRVEP